MLSRGGNSAYDTARGSHPVDLCMWRNDGSDLEFSQDTWILGHFVPWEGLRSLAREAGLGEIANSKIRYVSARNQSFVRTGVSAEGLVLQIGGPEERSEVVGSGCRLGHV